ncbi:PucR family transcriptional regulator [Streptomyces chartreusis]|uniref:PucR family transcriptional regulator n=1 Tax=Streptomyces chartreusis TaxID=1969 RepID=UPI003657600C
MNTTVDPVDPVDPVLRRLVDEQGAGLARGSGVTAPIAAVVICEPGDRLAGLHGTLVLAVAARGDEAVALVRSAAAAGAAAVAVRGEVLPTPVHEAAAETGTPVLGIPAAVRWDTVEAEARRVIGESGGAGRATARAEARRVPGADGGGGEDPVRAEVHGGRGETRGAGGSGPAVPHGDLFSLVQTVATLTRGVVSVEDTAHRVLAYSAGNDEADELRRRSILGRSCPEPYLALLREQGVYRRVRAGDGVVEVDARPELGARRRLVAGINAGSRPLGTLWVQEGDRPLAERADEVLRGAARLSASQLVDHYFHGDPSARLSSRAGLAHGLLTGRFDATALAAHLGIAPSASAAVVAVDLRVGEQPGDAGSGSGVSGSPSLDVCLAEAAGIVSVHAAAYRRNALVTLACGQIYAMLPDSDRTRQEDDGTGLVRWAGDVVAALRRHTGSAVQAVVAGTAARLDEIPAVKLRGHRALGLPARTPDRPVATYGELTAALLVRDVLDLMDRNTGLRHPGVTALLAHDREHNSELSRSLLRYLDGFGDAARVAKDLNVHPNTLRYRVRKALAVTGLDLNDPEHRLAATLHLRLAAEEEASDCPAGQPWPVNAVP